MDAPRISRRRFLQAASHLGLAAAGIHTLAGCATASAPMVVDPGLQLYTVRDALSRDFAATLDAVAAIGYRKVQVSPRLGHSPAQIRGWLDAAGLTSPSIHIDPRASVDEEIEAAHALGAQTAFLSAPVRAFTFEGGQPRLRDGLDLDFYREVADELDGTGERYRAAGILYGYHNHAFELAPIDGIVPYDLIVDRTDPARVALEMDLGWAHVGGIDPTGYFVRSPGRFPVWHVKDVAADGTFVDPGTGVVDFARSFAAADVAGLQHAFVEHDSPTDSMATAKVGYRAIRRFERTVSR